MTFVRCLALASLLALAAPALADVSISVDPVRVIGKWDGWGCSLCWWANQFGARDDLADALFTLKTVHLTTDAGSYDLPGLGMNIARYNIGGSGDTPGGQERMPAYKRIQGFWRDPDSGDPASASFDWDMDANQRAMLRKARARGANRIEAFSNSPMWWMCANGSAAGGEEGKDNLLPAKRAQFARYLALVARRAHDQWNVDFETVEPFNEPSAWWWRYPGGQEGCFVGREAQAEVIKALRRELDAQGLRSVGIAASDENSPDAAVDTWNALDASARAQVARVNVHNYNGQAAYRGPGRARLHAAVSAAGKPLWMTECGEADGAGRTMAQSIALDINQMRVSAWAYWQPLDSGGWGLIQSNPGDNWIGPPNARYYVLAQFSRHIRPGMEILNAGDPNTVAAWDPAARKLVLVTANLGAAQWLNCSLAGFQAGTGHVTRWTTGMADQGARYARSTDLAIRDGGVRAQMPANSVQTIEVAGISPARG
ncbi:MAG TPA: glycoside hydrolase [Armatimonadota bacterium]|jgi:galactan endo-1,6-beta-galactosidase